MDVLPCTSPTTVCRHDLVVPLADGLHDSRMLELLLQLLGVPKADTFDPADTQSYRQLILWLENTKV